MKPLSIVLGVALATACAFSFAQVPPGAQDYEAMAKAMEKAQAEASKPGDERLTCDQLQQQLVAIAQDPAYLAYVQAAGIQAQKDLAQMQIPQSEIAAKTAQSAGRVQMRMDQGQQMMAFMPLLMRGQRLVELATVRKCEWLTGLGMGAAPIPNR